MRRGAREGGSPVRRGIEIPWIEDAESRFRQNRLRNGASRITVWLRETASLAIEQLDREEWNAPQRIRKLPRALAYKWRSSGDPPIASEVP